MRPLIGVWLALIVFAWPAAAAPYKADPGPYKVETLLGVWHDSGRDRDVPYKIYYAPEAAGARPAVIFSHGLGGSREGGAYLGEHLASYGYVAVHIQHPGSDESVWRGLSGRDEIIKALTAATRDLSVIVNRFKDVPFALDQLAAMNAADGPLKGRIDFSRLGMSGHSFGAVSTLVAAGQRMGGRAQFSFKEPRFKAALAYSPNKPLRAGDLAAAYADIDMPILHFTGTEDLNPLDPDEPASDRQIPFRNIPAAGQYLIVIQGGDHMLFNAREHRTGEKKPDDDLDHRLILEASTAFWDAYLMGDAAALAWLRGDGAKSELGAEATIELRN